MIRNSAIFLLLLFVFSYCSDQVKEYDGFIQSELEFLLASHELKVWERIAREEDGLEVIPDDCEMDNHLIFFQGGVGAPKPLLYIYNPAICDSLDFCDQFPDYCQADTALCNANPEFCSTLTDGMLYIGSWYAKAPFIKNTRSDTLIFEINNKKESIFVSAISNQHATFQYKHRTGENGGIVTEFYQLLEPISEE